MVELYVDKPSDGVWQVLGAVWNWWWRRQMISLKGINSVELFQIIEEEEEK